MTHNENIQTFEEILKQDGRRAYENICTSQYDIHCPRVWVQGH